eukprot:CAMPEP_0202896808 /NCGR_PEP_ID=MMETSP1392-20130828/5730_1 /ASSEMBLY_ACC=CAM_ASM_000868 /TAXON_ID=225041 /ORGANISM="Chlamydomonas chlamydogama, Strain SAG 11-48b" /LENGTH=468 /DNA_ID=CAMNT_0049582285 /DNA_START=199 /DNA_END=1605 /DNA_ORIENTATION=-
MNNITYLSQNDAIKVDEELMGPLGFSVDQLMELAGLSVASALAAEYPAATHKRVLVLAGPGNNGGDGLVAARHLHHFGYDVTICYPKPTDKPLYRGLVTQCKSLGLSFVEWADVQAGGALASQADVVVDALFGFSFKGAPRPPFDSILQALKPASCPLPIVSVDIPSGWDVEGGDVAGDGIRPDMLVSLTTPKQAAKSFQGRFHYLGGRFVPPAIRDKYRLVLPAYPGTAQCVRIDEDAAAAAAAEAAAKKIQDMRISYEVGTLDEGDLAGTDPMSVWDEWFKQAVADKVCTEPNAISVATADSRGRPSVRVVLLKGYDERGFVFYTNYNSRKGQELDANGYASFAVYWEKLQRQVRVEGVVERVSEEESRQYFDSRPRGSRIGAWVSRQSQPLPGGREELEARNVELGRQYEDEAVPVPKPPHWGGYLIRPTTLEFWQGRPSRLHDRVQFTREDVGATEWKVQRLQP